MLATMRWTSRWSAVAKLGGAIEVFQRVLARLIGRPYLIYLVVFVGLVSLVGSRWDILTIVVLEFNLVPKDD